MDPIILEVWRRGEGDPEQYGWSVDFENTGLSQTGKTKTFDEAMRCVAGAIENAKGETK
jgi:hypothetical protein